MPNMSVVKMIKCRKDYAGCTQVNQDKTASEKAR